MHAAFLQVFDDIKQMADRSCQPVQAYDNKNVAGSEIDEKPSQHRSRAGCAGPLLVMDTSAACRPQLIDLCVVELIVRRNARVSEQPLWRWGRAEVCSFCQGFCAFQKLYR